MGTLDWLILGWLRNMWRERNVTISRVQFCTFALKWLLRKVTTKVLISGRSASCFMKCSTNGLLFHLKKSNRERSRVAWKIQKRAPWERKSLHQAWTFWSDFWWQSLLRESATIQCKRSKTTNSLTASTGRSMKKNNWKAPLRILSISKSNKGGQRSSSNRWRHKRGQTFQSTSCEGSQILEGQSTRWLQWDHLGVAHLSSTRVRSSNYAEESWQYRMMLHILF